MQPIPTQSQTHENASAISSVVGMKPTTSTAAQTSMAYSTSGSIMLTTPTVNNTCEPDRDPKCDGAQLNHNALFLFFIGLFLVFWQNAI